MSALVLRLPLPPSVNAMYRNVAGKGRVKTGAYKSWARAASSYAWRQKPIGGFPRYESDFEVAICVPAKMRGDVDNRAKATLDILKTWGIISDDRHAVAVSVRRVLDMPAEECRVVVRPSSPSVRDA